MENNNHIKKELCDHYSCVAIRNNNFMRTIAIKNGTLEEHLKEVKKANECFAADQKEMCRIEKKLVERIYNAKTLTIKDLIQCTHFLSVDDGNLVCVEIKKAFEAGHRVLLSFSGMETLTTAFVNAALGRLLSDYSLKEVNDRLAVIDIDIDEKNHIRRILKTTNVYNTNPDVRKTVNKAVRKFERGEYE